MKIIHRVKNISKTLLPVRYDKPFDKNFSGTLYKSFALQRSGQHVIIDWICRGFGDILHLNNCCFYRKSFIHTLSPMTGRRVAYYDKKIDDSGAQGRDNFYFSLSKYVFKNLFYSIEDKSIEEPLYKKLTNAYPSTTIIILRDPANWLASSLKANRWTLQQLLKKRMILIEYLQQAKIAKKKYLFINYNAFFSNFEYRETLADILNLVYFSEAEEALKYTPNFGGGSSFKNGCRNTLERWKNYKHNSLYQKLLNDKRLYDLALDFFGEIPGFPS